MRKATKAEVSAGLPPLVSIDLPVQNFKVGKHRFPRKHRFPSYKTIDTVDTKDKILKPYARNEAETNDVGERLKTQIDLIVADEATTSGSSLSKKHSLFEERQSTLDLDIMGKEQLTEADRSIFKEIGVSESEMVFFTNLFHNHKQDKHIRGLNKKEFQKSLRLDDFWTTKIFDKFTCGERMELFEFVFVCVTLRPCKTEKSLQRKCELMACAIADVESIDRSNMRAVVGRDQVEKFVRDSAQGLRVRCGNNLVAVGVETLANLFDTDSNGTVEISEIRDWLLENQHLIQDLGYDPKITRGLTMMKSRLDIVEDMTLEIYLQELSFQCGMDASQVPNWKQKLNEQGIFKSISLVDVTKQDWVHLMGLPLAVYKQICQDLNLVYEAPQRISPSKPTMISRLRSMVMHYWSWFVIAGLISFSIWLGVSSIDESQRTVFGIEIYFARGSAGIILLFSVLIVFWVSYYSISKFTRALPFNSYLLVHNQQVHMMSGFTITSFAIVHAIAWCVSYRRGADSSQQDWDQLSGTAQAMREHWTKPPSQSDFHFSLAGITGWIMTICLVIMAFTSRTSFRKKHFNTFFNLHHLYIVFFACLFLHGSQELMGKQKVWMLTAPFFILFLLDKAYGIILRNKPHPASFNEEKSSQGTVRLDIRFPRTDVKSSLGKWVWINIPEISRLEWHPFTVAYQS